MLSLKNTYAETAGETKSIKSPSGNILTIVSSEEWKNIDKGIDFKIIKFKRGDGIIAFKLLRIDPQSVVIKVIYNRSSNVKSITEKEGAIAAINGSFFDVNGEPLGLLISDGKTINRRIATHPLYSGIFYVKDSIPHIVYRDDFAADGVTQALQVGPVLIADGKDTDGLKDTNSIHYRSGIATDGLNRVIIYATDTNYNGLSFYEIRQIMRLPDINCTHVLNLDGGGSTQMFVTTPSFSDYTAGKSNIPVAIGFYPHTKKSQP
ncbi:MAG: phosphodiester glycosidase family protein [Nitrospinae bacterium]|nr:phosphodiester glycosidase family protein [Nitrospinota bacterium]